jgi:hypothetical protein
MVPKQSYSRVIYLFRVFEITRAGSAERNASVCCTNSRRSETHPHSAQRTPSGCAAREWRQISHFFAGALITMIFIKSDACAVVFSSA